MVRDALQTLDKFAKEAQNDEASRIAFQGHSARFQKVKDGYLLIDKVIRQSLRKDKRQRSRWSRDLHRLSRDTIKLSRKVGGRAGARMRRELRRALRQKRNPVVVGGLILMLFQSLQMKGGGDGGGARLVDQGLRLMAETNSKGVEQVRAHNKLQDQRMDGLQAEVKVVAGKVAVLSEFQTMSNSLWESESTLDFATHAFNSAKQGMLDMVVLNRIDFDQLKDEMEHGLPDEEEPIPETREDLLSCRTSLLFGEGYFAVMVEIPMKAAEKEMKVLSFNGAPVRSNGDFMTVARNVEDYSLVVSRDYYAMMSRNEVNQCRRVDRYLDCVDFSQVTVRVPKVVDCKPGRKEKPLCLLAIYKGAQQAIDNCCDLEELPLYADKLEVFYSAVGDRRMFQIFSAAAQMEFDLTCYGRTSRHNMTSGQSVDVPHECNGEIEGHPLQIGTGRSHFSLTLETDASMAGAVYTKPDVAELNRIVRVFDQSSEMRASRKQSDEAVVTDARVNYKTHSQLIICGCLRLNFVFQANDKADGMIDTGMAAQDAAAKQGNIIDQIWGWLQEHAIYMVGCLMAMGGVGLFFKFGGVALLGQCCCSGAKGRGAATETPPVPDLPAPVPGQASSWI